MSAASLPLQLLLICALALPLSGFGACSATPSSGSALASCESQGKRYKEGEAFQEQCNDCTCSRGNLACTARACTDTATGTATDHSTATAELCAYEGESYAVGESFAAKDGCNTCACSAGGSVDCTLIACASEEGQALAFEDLVTGNVSSSDADETYLVRDSLTWNGLYTEIATGGEVAPKVNFINELVVGVIRQHATGGYAVKIKSVAYSDAGLKITVLVTTPEPGCQATQTSTQPHHFVRVSLPPDTLAALVEVKSANDAEFVTETAVTRCD